MGVCVSEDGRTKRKRPFDCHNCLLHHRRYCRGDVQQGGSFDDGHENAEVVQSKMAARFRSRVCARWERGGDDGSLHEGRVATVPEVCRTERVPL